MSAVGVDFDGVIHRYGRGWQDGSIYDLPVEGALDGLRALMLEYPVFILTSRSPSQVAEWLREHGFLAVTDGSWNGAFWDITGMLLVTSRKLPAAAYLDDRAVRFTSWAQALADLAALVPRPPAP